MRCDVVVVGSYNQDYAWRTDCLPQPGETRRALGFATGPGGKGYNQAVACQRLEVTTCFIAALGDDGVADLARRSAEREGLACRWQTVAGAVTGSACVLIDARGQNQILVHLAANKRLDPEFVRARRDDFRGARVVLTQLENNLDAVAVALGLGRAHGMLCLLNPAPMHAGVDAALLAACDVITPNETEFAELLTRFDGPRLDPSALADSTDVELHALARRLPVPTVVITLGAQGCFVSHAEGVARAADEPLRYRLAAEAAAAVDTSGAGDAFSGALAAAIARDTRSPFIAAVRVANCAAALSTERAGAAQAMPAHAELRARFGI